MTMHPLEVATIKREPELGADNVSKCLPGWIETFCKKFEEGKGHNLSHSAVNCLLHTLIAARLRSERLTRELEDATGSGMGYDEDYDHDYGEEAEA